MVLFMWAIIAAGFVQHLEAATITFQIVEEAGGTNRLLPEQTSLKAFLAQNPSVLERNMSVPAVTVRVAGSTSLPDPEPVNAFLAQNASVLNPLLPSHPPLQLQKCNASLYQTSAFDYYVIQHTRGGCEHAPGMARDSKAEEETKNYERNVCTSLVLLGALLVLWLIGYCVLGESFRSFSQKVGRRLAEVPAKFIHRSDGELDRNDLCLMASFCVAFIGGVMVYLLKYGQKVFLMVPLPDPAPLNDVFASSGLNVTLYLCTVRGLFQVYLGFADSCSQVEHFIFPEALPPAPFHSAHEGRLTALIALAVVISFFAWTFIATGVVSWVCTSACGCILSGIKKLVGLDADKRVYSVELQAPAGSAV